MNNLQWLLVAGFVYVVADLVTSVHYDRCILPLSRCRECRGDSK